MVFMLCFSHDALKTANFYQIQKQYEKLSIMLSYKQHFKWLNGLISLHMYTLGLPSKQSR